MKNFLWKFSTSHSLTHKGFFTVRRPIRIEIFLTKKLGGKAISVSRVIASRFISRQQCFQLLLKKVAKKEANLKPKLETLLPLIDRKT